jgi:hypothetical protein
MSHGITYEVAITLDEFTYRGDRETKRLWAGAANTDDHNSTPYAAFQDALERLIRMDPAFAEVIDQISQMGKL